jgi:hypothetical protein
MVPLLTTAMRAACHLAPIQWTLLLTRMRNFWGSIATAFRKSRRPQTRRTFFSSFQCALLCGVVQGAFNHTRCTVSVCSTMRCGVKSLVNTTSRSPTSMCSCHREAVSVDSSLHDGCIHLTTPMLGRHPHIDHTHSLWNISTHVSTTTNRLRSLTHLTTPTIDHTYTLTTPTH